MSQANNSTNSLRRLLTRELNDEHLGSTIGGMGGGVGGRYIALMDLNHFLTNDHIDAIPQSNELLLLKRQLGAINPSMIELPATSRTFGDLENGAPAAPPLPRMMKNLLKDRRRFQRQFIAAQQLHSQSPPNLVPIQQQSHFQQQQQQKEANKASDLKRYENYQLKAVFAAESDTNANRWMSNEFSTDLLLSTMCNNEEQEEDEEEKKKVADGGRR